MSADLVGGAGDAALATADTALAAAAAARAAGHREAAGLLCAAARTAAAAAALLGRPLCDASRRRGRGAASTRRRKEDVQQMEQGQEAKLDQVEQMKTNKQQVSSMPAPDVCAAEQRVEEVLDGARSEGFAAHGAGEVAPSRPVLPPAPGPAQQGGDLQGSPTLTDSLESELAAKRAQAAPDICTVPVTRVHVHASMTKAKVSFLEATVAQGLLREAPALSIGTTAVCDWSPVTGDLKSAFMRFAGPVSEAEIREYFRSHGELLSLLMAASP